MSVNQSIKNVTAELLLQCYYLATFAATTYNTASFIQ